MHGQYSTIILQCSVGKNPGCDVRVHAGGFVGVRLMSSRSGRLLTEK